MQNDMLHRGMAFGGILYITMASRATKLLNEFLSRSYRLAHELDKARAVAESTARTDVLTGLRNRRAFYEQGEAVVQNATRSGRSCAAVMIDIDRFKSINDRFGHAAGDEVIKSLATVLKDTVRDGELAARLGGEEFVVLLPEGSSADAEALAERIRTRAEAHAAIVDSTEIAFTVSLGVASRGDDCATLDALIAFADSALYASKEGGRNKVSVAPPRNTGHPLVE
ncbi:MAG: GGDEF domain-containing protein [Sandaracinaceae bacterium]|nr:GGDEF domain-containing protein [Sandaracinaceae bacterium]